MAGWAGNGPGNRRLQMAETVIIFSSKTGFSQRYAQWLAEDLHCQAVPFKERSQIHFAEYDTIILIGGLYVGQMAGLKWFKAQPFTGKRLAAVAVGCAPIDFPSLPESMSQLFGETPQIKGFYCQGGLDYTRMGAVHRTMMAALRMALKGKPDQKEMLEGISHSFDGTDRSYLSPVAAWAREG